jgi:beta-alanine--pyruvate transaminase
MGAVFVHEHVYQGFMNGPESAIEFFHGYTYSGHPVACAAALATLDIYQREELFQRSINLENYWADAMHSLKGLPNVQDIRTIGLVGGVQLATHNDGAGKRGFSVFEQCFADDILVRSSGDTIALSPPLIVEKAQIDILVDKLANAIRLAI